MPNQAHQNDDITSCVPHSWIAKVVSVWLTDLYYFINYSLSNNDLESNSTLPFFSLILKHIYITPSHLSSILLTNKQRQSMSTKLVSVLKKRTITFKPEDEVLNNEEALLLQNLKRPRSNSPPTANESMDDPTFSSQTRQSNSPPPAYRNVNTVPRTQSHNKVLHVGICPGDLASRVLLIGDSHRAAYLASHLSPRKSDGSQLFISSSSKGYTTYTGTYLGIDISIVSFGMGVSMIDFLVREGRGKWIKTMCSRKRFWKPNFLIGRLEDEPL